MTPTLARGTAANYVAHEGPWCRLADVVTKTHPRQLRRRVTPQADISRTHHHPFPAARIARGTLESAQFLLRYWKPASHSSTSCRHVRAMKCPSSGYRARDAFGVRLVSNSAPLLWDQGVRGTLKIRTGVVTSYGKKPHGAARARYSSTTPRGLDVPSAMTWGSCTTGPARNIFSFVLCFRAHRGSDERSSSVLCDTAKARGDASKDDWCSASQTGEGLIEVIRAV